MDEKTLKIISELKSYILLKGQQDEKNAEWALARNVRIIGGSAEYFRGRIDAYDDVLFKIDKIKQSYS